MYLRIEQGLGPPRYIPLSGALAPANLLYGTGTIIYGPTEKSMMAGKGLSDDEKIELKEQFLQIDKDESGFIDFNELKEALDLAGFKVPGWRVRDLIDKFGREKEVDHVAAQRKLSYHEFEHLCCELKSKDVSQTFKQKISRKENIHTHGGISDASAEGTTHSVRFEEQLAFSDWVNTNLGHDPDLRHILPLDGEGLNLYEAVKDGILLCKIINHSCPDTVDERTIDMKPNSVYKRHENLTLALSSAQSIGVNLVNIDANDLIKGTQHLVLGLLWQIIRIGLFNQISLEQCPGLANLLQGGEQLDQLMKMSPEAILLRWVNHQLERAGVQTRINNFSADIKNSEAYTHLLHQIAAPDSGVNKEALMEDDLQARAERMLEQADKLGCRAFISPQVNVVFVNSLNLCTNRKTRCATFETYRNWMNSLGVSPYVNWLYSDLADGLVIFQLYDIIQPGAVTWNKVHKTFNRMRKFMEKLENCNYVVDLGRKQKYSLVGIAGQDICDGNATLTLALVWQLMRSYTLNVLANLGEGKHIEGDIIKWVNDKLQTAGKSSKISSFQDGSISTGLPLIDLIDSIKPGCINYDLVLDPDTEEDKIANAKYGISMARRLGARVYALPEDIVEIKPKMVMTVFAVLMSRDYVPNMDSKQ
ncbi:plastin-3 [Eurytemora carolleeae]|uniref:plastin-3 n=1 Tax=Eurytemora carolleeae TaxID=1294199 RepID=UPI000C7872E6|nr:plastin-3 [Eurytemora carolleeae]|eukprot:XP_023344853.1 plastin-3-like [Eurytemora affinis]